MAESKKLNEMSEKALVGLMVSAKDREAKAKLDYKAASAELQRRAIGEIEDHNVKFVRFRGAKGSVMVTKKGSFSFINPMGFRQLIGAELFDSLVSTEQCVSYKSTSAFEAALRAVFLRDYDFGMQMDDVYDLLNADQKQRSVLDKKLKGQYEKDAVVLESMFGQKDFDTELYCIYKIKNAERIRIFFPEATEAQLEELRRYLLVEENISVTLTK